MSRSVTTLTVLCLLLASQSGCHLIGGDERTWDVNPEVRNATAIEDGYMMEMGFQFGGRADAPVNMEGVKLVFISPDGTISTKPFWDRCNSISGSMSRST